MIQLFSLLLTLKFLSYFFTLPLTFKLYCSFFNRRKLSIWKGKDGKDTMCNEFRGTDGTQFPPRVEKTFVDIFQPDICRSVKMEYEKEVEVERIDALRFVLAKQNFQLPIDKDPNPYYC